MSPSCLNCGSTVSKRYVEVMTDETGDIRACPHCEDRRIQSGEVYEYR